MNTRIEFDKSLINKYSHILGIDEVGWGCVAGPLVLGGCLIPKDFYTNFDFFLEKYPFLKDVKDSKKISEKNRIVLFEKLKKVKEIQLYQGSSSVDEINNLKLAKSYTNCIDTILKNVKETISLEKILIIIDGNRDPKSNITKNVSLIIKGDDKSFAIASASLFAKEFRDTYMRDLDDKIPGFNFTKHKGYGTEEHTNLIIKNGLSIEHRKEASLKLIQD